MPIQFNEHITDALTIAADGVHAVSESAGTYLTSAADLKLFRKLLAVLDVGVMSSSSTLTFSIVAAKTAAGSYTPVTGLSATQLTQAGGNGGQYVTIGVSAQVVQNLLGNGYEFVKAQAVVAVAATVMGMHLIGACGPWEPSGGNAATTLVQALEL